MNKQKINMIILAVVIIGFGIGGYLYWRHNELYPSTDDAYVDANVINIAAQVNGPVKATYVKNYQYVIKGEPLLSIDPKPFEIAVQKATAELNLAEQKVAGEQAAVKAATAQVAERRNELILAEQNAHRMLPLVRTGRIAKTQGDEVTEKLHVASSALEASKQNLQQTKQQLGTPGQNNAEIRNAKAALAKTKLDLSHTHINAPNAGRLINFDTRIGDMITSGNTLFSIIEQHVWWVNANYKETQLKRIRLGQPATIIVDSYPDHSFKGIVQSVSQGSGSAFALLPAENATGNWVKVTQRFPVKIKIINPSSKYPLRIRASTTATVNTLNLHADNTLAGALVRDRNPTHH